MLIDGITLTQTGFISSLKIESGNMFPALAIDGQIFKLLQSDQGKTPGLHYWNEDDSSWIPMDNRSILAGAEALATLENGKLASSQLPSLAITDVLVVGSQVAMLALTAQKGDVAIRTDLSKSFILSGDDPTILGNWTELLSPADSDTSTPYDIATYIRNKPEGLDTVLVFYTPRNFSFPNNLSGSVFKAGVAATGQSIFSLKKNDVEFATATFSASGVTASFSANGQIDFNAGDKLSIVAPTNQDTTLANIYISLAGSTT